MRTAVHTTLPAAVWVCSASLWAAVCDCQAVPECADCCTALQGEWLDESDACDLPARDSSSATGALAGAAKAAAFANTLGMAFEGADDFEASLDVQRAVGLPADSRPTSFTASSQPSASTRTPAPIHLTQQASMRASPQQSDASMSLAHYKQSAAQLARVWRSAHRKQRLLLDQDVRDMAHEHDFVCMVFTDIVGYTAMCNEVDNSTAIMMYLNELFSLFDVGVGMNECYKLETVGDAYIVAAGLLQQARCLAASWLRP